MKVQFRIDTEYLLIHTLTSTSKDRFSSPRFRKDIIAFQNTAWKLSELNYNTLRGRWLPGMDITKISKSLPRFFSTLQRSASYRKIYQQTERYRLFCESQWHENYEISAVIIKQLTGFSLKRNFKVYITHPSLRSGKNIGDNIILWGHHEMWPNYSTVYLWHEILHSYFPRTEQTHALIQLIADNELRTVLNGDAYPPFEGHKNLFPLMRQMLPRWKRYVRDGIGDIKKFPLKKL